MKFRERAWAIVLVAVLVFFAWVICTIDVPSQSSAKAGSLWRRTADGWELAWWLAQPCEPTRKMLHPLVLAGAQLLVALVGMLACGGRSAGSSIPRTSCRSEVTKGEKAA